MDERPSARAKKDQGVKRDGFEECEPSVNPLEVNQCQSLEVSMLGKAMNRFAPAAGRMKNAQAMTAALVAAVFASVVSSVAGAFAAPAAGAFGYDIYNLVVNQILAGPIGFVGAIALIVWGATKLTTNWMLCIMCLIAGTVIIRADAIVQTLGALV
jgi:hypothetical protein